MAKFDLNVPIETAEPTIEVSASANAPLTVGVHRFQLVVRDDSGNLSLPTFVDVVVRDTQRPTAVLDVSSPVEFGASFDLSGKRSSDVAPGRVASYIWSMVPIVDRPNITDVLNPLRPNDVVISPIRPG